MSDGPIRIAIQHRYPALRAFIAQELGRRFGAEVAPLDAGPDRAHAEAMARALAATQPAVVVLDLEPYRQAHGAGTLTALELVRAVRSASFAARIVALSDAESCSFINAVLRAWADAHLVMTGMTMGELTAACEATLAGALFLCTRSKRILAAGCAQAVDLTPREVEIVRLLAARPGDRYEEIASALHVSGGTLRTHLANLRLKLGVTDNREVVSAVRALGLVE